MKLKELLIESMVLDIIDEYQVRIESLINDMEDKKISSDEFKNQWKKLSIDFEQNLKTYLKNKKNNSL